MELNHIAMSVPVGGLSEEWRCEVADFYGRHFGWREIERLRRPDRMTLSVGAAAYINIRERPDPMTCSGYEHFGLTVASAEQLRGLWRSLWLDAIEPRLEPVNERPDGFCSFRFRHLLPLAVEVQYFPT